MNILAFVEVSYIGRSFLVAHKIVTSGAEKKGGRRLSDEQLVGCFIPTWSR